MLSNLLRLSPCVAVVTAGAALLAGCGSSHRPSSPSSTASSTTTTPAATVIGPRDLGANMQLLMSKSQPYLKNVKTSCLPGPAPRFPDKCTFTALDTGEPISAAALKKHPSLARQAHTRYRVAGTITVLGVYSRTRTYEYGLEYGPIH